MSEQCQHVLVYVEVLGGYNLTCRHCGQVYGYCEIPDPEFLAGLNRNAAVKGKSSGRRKHRKTARAPMPQSPQYRMMVNRLTRIGALPILQSSIL